MRCLGRLVFCLLVVADAAAAQTLEGCGADWVQLSDEGVRMGEQHYRRKGNVEVTCSDMKFFADEMDFLYDKHLLIARGNVVFRSGGNQISGDRMEFDTTTRTGTFYNAFGTASLGDRADRSLFGTQEPYADFYGETIEKIGPKKYRITRGGFTTCVQPTPRWEITSGTATLNLDDYALLRNSVLRVKGVPLLYLPVFYYPIQEDDRATGFLIPTYGASTYKGQTISNAFFWAIGRSHDATIFHDWFSKTGQGVGGEYRYVLSGESSGNVRTYVLDEHEVALPGGGTQPGQRSSQVFGSAAQRLPLGLRARAQAQYSSNLTVQQLYHQNLYQASIRQRSLGANVSGAWGPYLMSGSFDRSEVFNGLSGTDSNINGSAPRLTFSRSERPLGDTPVYVGVTGEYGALVRENRTATRIVDQGLQRLDVTPQVRVPFTRWPFLTINSSIAWRNTFWTESLDPTGIQIEEGISRRYVDLQSGVTGPVFTRVFNTPGSGYAEKLKHVIEPSVTFRRISDVDVVDRIVKIDGTDYVVGGVTQIVYGLTNRLYAKRREGGPQAIAREILSFSLGQSYYTDANAARVDQNYQSGFSGAQASRLSPLAAVLRLSPIADLQGELRAEYDTRFKALLALNASGTLRRERVEATGTWSERRFIDPATGVADPNRRDQFLGGATTLRMRGNRFGGTYSFNWDLFRKTLLQQRMVGYYNAQCCGVGVEYQTFNFGGSSVIPQDRRFNISFTLAGIGTFSNFFGALGGSQSR
jgi:LPS-assembly protein